MVGVAYSFVKLVVEILRIRSFVGVLMAEKEQLVG